MNPTARLVRWALRTPPHLAARRAWHEVRARERAFRTRRRDARDPSYGTHATPPGLRRLITNIPVADAEPWFGALRFVSANYLDHRFDILGSGWTRCAYGLEASGLEGHRFPSTTAVEPDAAGRWLNGRVSSRNLAESQARWALVGQGYEPIDWQLDLKSGWRWSSQDWYRDVRIVGPLGSDPKVPWELARLQHLPQLALSAAIARVGVPGFKEPVAYEREFRNQVLDFVATNPPRYGINWAMPMEVAVRLVNLLIARDLFLAAGASFDEAFERYFHLTVLDHARHVARNLEWHERWRGNHFLADLAGLAVAGAYLSPSAEASAWARTARRGIEREVACQFLPDGANAEASTSYHALATELVAFSAAALESLTPERSPRLRDIVRSCLCRAGQFSLDVTMSAGRVCQVGDNDSGRLVKLIPNLRPEGSEADLAVTLTTEQPHGGGTRSWREEHLDHRPVVAAVDTLAPTEGFERFASDFRLVSSVVGQLAGGVERPRMSAPDDAARVSVGSESDLAAIRQIMDDSEPTATYSVHFDIPGWPRAGVIRLAYPDFGLFIWKSSMFFAAVRCGPVGQGGRGGHAHNDQLAIELCVDGTPWTSDPGTYVYTALPVRRNEYRSVRAHFTPRVGDGEPRSLEQGLFELGRGSSPRCVYWGESGFAGRHRWADGRTVYCTVELGASGLVARVAARGAVTEFTGVIDWSAANPAIEFSPGYGLRERQKS
jgi:hypothetical protein